MLLGFFCNSTISTIIYPVLFKNVQNVIYINFDCDKVISIWCLIHLIGWASDFDSELMNIHSWKVEADQFSLAATLKMLVDSSIVLKCKGCRVLSFYQGRVVN